jgi:hypothetical protein
MLTDEHVKKLYRLFCRKLEEVYEKNACPDPFGGKQIVEFNAWQTFLRSSLSLEVVDIEEGEQPGFMRIGGQFAAIRISNPSNETGLGREFIIVPLEFAERSLVLDGIPEKWPLPEG